jgi:hypothetical protein
MDAQSAPARARVDSVHRPAFACGRRMFKCKKSNEVFMGDAELSLQAQLSIMLGAYKAAVEEWITAIREEESLASGDSTVAQVDDWEQAHFKEEEA